MKSIFLFAFFTAFSLFCRAAEPAVTPATEKLAAENARAAARRNDATTAEQLLTAVNHAQPNTSWWHVESAQRLIQLAYDVPREGRSEAIPTFVSRALQHLATAETLTTDARQKAAIKSLTGRIQERYLGDHAAALASHRAAAALAPDNPQAQKEAARLERINDHVAARARK